jgi:hypothetical protein
LEFIRISGCDVNKILIVTRQKFTRDPIFGGNGQNGLELHLWYWLMRLGAVKLPNSCPTSHCVQTPVTQHQENDSPNVKKANVYGTSVNIDDSCAPGA